MNIAFIPIDNRPVCYQLPQQIASLSEENKLYLPDRSLLGDLYKVADYNGILSWFETLNSVDVAVISLDTIAYGGLVSSRRSNDTYERIKERINKLSDILERKKIKVYAFSSIMRISNNNINEEEKEYWNQYGKRIFEYSYNMHKMEKNCAGENMLACNCAATRIPQDILEDYLLTRKRNFDINKYYVELTKKGLFDTLVFSKDDCSKYGLNVKESEELISLSKDLNNVFVKTGADEIPLTLLSKAINQKKNIKIAPIYTNPDSIDKISKYEDISVEQSVKSQIELSGGIVSDIENCDMVLLVNNFSNEQGELVMNVEETLFCGKLDIPNKPYFIADILNANGSDNNFVGDFFEYNDLNNFYGYAGWNTTGNTLGSVLSCALTYYNSDKKNKNAFKELQFIRFLDDWAYQANVRSKIRDNSENLTNSIIEIEMKQYSEVLKKIFDLRNIEIEYKFPWNRFFEIEIILKKV